MKCKSEQVILIVCEGTNTEPDYFMRIQSAIKNALKKHRTPEEKKLTSAFIIQLAEEDKTRFFDDIIIERPYREALKLQTNRKGIKKRKFEKVGAKKTTIDVLKELCLERYGETEGAKTYEEVKAYPLRFVALAKVLQEMDMLYNESWAVFDKDRHTQHKKAYQLAARNHIHIAFSSRSFEYWILLHFERIYMAFPETECKLKSSKNRSPIDCGLPESTHPFDCKGATCITGYIRQHTPLQYYAKSNKQADLTGMMQYLLSEHRLIFALENAAWLRYQQRKQFGDIPIYEANPYTDIDQLVKSLLGITTNYTWTDLDTPTDFATMQGVVVTQISDYSLQISADKMTANPTQCTFYLKDKQRAVSPLLLALEDVDFAKVSRQHSFKVVSPTLIAGNDFCFQVGQEVLMVEVPTTPNAATTDAKRTETTQSAD